MEEREQREKKNRISVKKLVAVLIVALLLLVAVCVLLFTRVETVTVEGNQHYSDEEVVDMLFPQDRDRISIYCYFKHRFREAETVPFIDSYELNFKGPKEVEIILYEKAIVGCIEYMGSYMYFDKDGLVVESSPEQEADVPTVVGLDFKQIVLYQILPVPKEEVFEEILTLTQQLQDRKIPTARISFDELGQATLVLKDRKQEDGSTLILSGVKVMLGGQNDIEEKVWELQNHLSVLNGLRGTLHLEDFDPNSLNPYYIFETE